ncbi:MAG: sensor histidine kinase [Chloroflexota bacterium]
MYLDLKLIRAQFVLTFLAILAVSSAAAAGWLGWLPGYPGAHLLWIGGLGAALASLLGWAANHWIVTSRLQRAAEIGSAWLRGDLNLRIEEAEEDEFGRLTDHLDQLIQQLAHYKQDLIELQQREDRLSDQVRVLSISEERSRLAHDLHDGVKQQLFSMAMIASGIQDRANSQADCMPSEMLEMIGQLKISAQTAQQDLTRLIEGLRPISIQERGLGAALNEYALLFGAREHLLIYLDVQGNDGLLPISIAEMFYLVAQEALNNVARHASATRVDVKLSCFPDEASLTVRDNGRGFDLSRPRRGLGITSMQDRLTAVGGRLSLNSSPGRGTILIAQVGLGRPLLPPGEQARLDPNRPQIDIENWLWLGQRLVIPVGQTWPWLPADEDYLRRPLLDKSQVVRAQVANGVFGLGKGLQLQTGDLSVQVRQAVHGYSWRLHGARWNFKRLSSNGSQVLFRNGQPLAAVQYQGRQMDMWSEFVYIGRGYRLAAGHKAGMFQFYDEDGQEIAQFNCRPGLEIEIYRPLSLNLLIIALLRLLDEKKAAH